MMTQITSSVSLVYSATTQTQNALTDEQTQGLDELMSEYDTASLSDADAEAIVSGISELGITPGEELAEALSGFGVDARELADQAGVGRPEGPPPGGGGKGGGGGEGETSSVNEVALSVLESVLESMEEDDEITSEEFQELLETEMEAAGLDASESIMDIIL